MTTATSKTARESVLELSPTFLEVLKQRDLHSPEEIHRYLYPDFSHLHDPFLMKGMTEAVQRLQDARERGEKVMIHGDYDVDGITGSATVALAFKKLNLHFECFLPEREVDGYGVSMRAINSCPEKGISLFVTVDCGITAKSQITAAKELGLDVIILDHHRLPSDGLPPADAILNPLQEDCPYPFKLLSAGGIAFKLAQALLGEEAYELLDLSALSTISDVVGLKDENRLLVKEGLKKLSSRTSPGIKALAEVSKVRAANVNVGHVAFMLAPRINAAGRMSTPDIAFQLLTTDSLREAASLAKILNSENDLRKEVEKNVNREAKQYVDSSVNFNHEKVIVAYKPNWHVGVIGITAARLVEKYHRPAVVIGDQDGVGKASGRSVKGFHLFKAFQYCEDLLENYGGHELAAGLSIKPENVDAFRKKINEYAETHLNPNDLQKQVKVDLEISLADLSAQLLAELDLMEPFGMGNSRPVFLTQGLKLKSRVRKKYGDQYEAAFTDGQKIVQGTFDGEDASTLSMDAAGSFNLYYQVKSETVSGNRAMTLLIKKIDQSAD